MRTGVTAEPMVGRVRNRFKYGLLSRRMNTHLLTPLSSGQGRKGEPEKTALEVF